MDKGPAAKYRQSIQEEGDYQEFRQVLSSNPGMCSSLDWRRVFPGIAASE
jgi:hypothetical protein